jgi:hypothetical protein
LYCCVWNVNGETLREVALIPESVSFEMRNGDGGVSG